MAATIRDVASAAGVSQSTVSRALSMPELVNPATRARVLEAAGRLGYQPNRAARGLITGRTGNLGLIVPDLSNPFFSSVVKGVQAAARGADYSVFIADTDEEASAEVELLRALTKQVDGIVLCSPRSPDDELARVGVDSSVVLMNRRIEGRPSVTVDNADGMRQAVEHLSALGHERIAYVAGPRTSWSNGERERGLHQSAEATGTRSRASRPLPAAVRGRCRRCRPGARVRSDRGDRLQRRRRAGAAEPPRRPAACRCPTRSAWWAATTSACPR